MEFYFLSVSREDLRIFPTYFFTGRDATADGPFFHTAFFRENAFVSTLNAAFLSGFFPILVYILFSAQRSSKKRLTFPQGDAV